MKHDDVFEYLRNAESDMKSRGLVCGSGYSQRWATVACVFMRRVMWILIGLLYRSSVNQIKVQSDLMFALFLTASVCLSMSPNIMSSLRPVEQINQTFDESIDYVGVSLTIISCRFINSFETTGEHDGGAIDAHSSRVKIESTLFFDCISEIAGAVSFTNCTVTMTDTNFTANTALEDGGAGILDRCDVDIREGKTKGNEAMKSTGGFVFIQCRGAIKRHAFLSNKAHGTGVGGIIVSGSPIWFTDCTFIHNHVDFGYSGGVLLEHPDGTSIFDACCFISNEVSGVAETHVFVTGSASSSVKFLKCKFDTPLSLAVIKRPNFEGEEPSIDLSSSIFDLQHYNKWSSEAEEQMEHHVWESILIHSQSDKFAIAMFIMVPLFITVVVLVLRVSV